MTNVSIILFLVILTFGAILLQIFLSKRDRRWFGFILPSISFLVSLMIVIAIIAYTNIGIATHSVSNEEGIVSFEIDDTRPDFGSVAVQVIFTFLLTNIPTVVLIVIYAACRDTKRRRLEIEKMQIQDLE